MTTVAIIQARMSSTRFPGKMLSPLAGLPMIDRVIESVRGAHDGKIIVATSDQRVDDPLAYYIKNKAYVDVFRGSMNNPLQRMYRAAVSCHAETVMRVTGDCPLVDSRSIANALNMFEKLQPLAYFGRTNSPDGDDVEVFSMSALAAAYEFAGPNEIEHTTTWIRKNCKCESLESHPDYAGVHYSVNSVDDLRLCERLIAKCGEGARFQDYADAYREIMG